MVAGLIPARLLECSVVESRQIGAYRLVAFIAPEIASLAHPGQFLMVRCSGPSVDPLLPRPMGILDIESDLVKMLIEPVGKGTTALAGVQVGDRLSILGPLGRGFAIEGEGPALLIGGGIGISPLVLLAKSLVKRSRQVHCLLGFKTRLQAVAAELFRGVSVDIFTEDGSMGRQGLVSDPVGDYLAGAGPPGPAPALFACGPSAMLKEIARLAHEYGVRAQLSVASHMACGIGSCQGCVVKS